MATYGSQPPPTPASLENLNKNPAGRPKGAENKIGKTLKDAIAASFDEVGAKDWLVKLAKENPKSYAMLLCKMIPQQTQAVDHNGDDAPLQISIIYKKTEDPKYIDAEPLAPLASLGGLDGSVSLPDSEPAAN